MLPSGWCSALGLGNGEELGPSFPSRCYPRVGKQELLLLSLQTRRCQGGKEAEECRAGMGSTAKGAGKLTAQDLFDAAFFCRRSREDGGSRSTKLLLVSSCPERLSRGKWEQP